MKETELKEVTQNFDGSTSTRVITSTGAESSVEIAQNSKGELRVTVKAYHSQIEVAMAHAIATYHTTIEELKNLID